MGRFERFVSTPALMEFDRKVGDVVIPMIAFIEGGMTIPMGRITRDYLCARRLCPHQCALNFFRVLGSIDALDRHLGLGLTWHNVAHLYEGHRESRASFYLKSRNSVAKLISCLSKSNKGMKDDYLILSGPWSDSLACPTKLGKPGGAI